MEIKINMKCSSIETLNYGSAKEHKVKLDADGINESISDVSTQCGCWILIGDGNSTLNMFDPMKKYAITITERE
jgi:hypothetical protein